MTPLQQAVLAAIKRDLDDPRVNARAWLKPSYVMAIIDGCEDTGWITTAVSQDGDDSIGLMQVTPGTARDMGVAGSQAIPENSVLAGMRWLAACYVILSAYYGAPPAIEEVIAAYNEGPGNVEKGNSDSHYVARWKAKLPVWAFVDTLS
jgi:soluble lytic murein transglycosylase-like protein